MVLFVINPASGTYRFSVIKSIIDKVSVENKVDYDLLETTGHDDVRNIRQFVESNNPEKVIAVGGDGTLNNVAVALAGKNIPLGIIPAGSANGMATELRIPSDPERAVNIALQGKTVAIDAVSVNDRFVSLHFSDIGLNARVVERFEKNKVRGFRGYLKEYVKELFHSKTMKHYLKVDGEMFSTHSMMLMIANAQRFGTGAYFNPEGKLDDGFFELIIFKKYPVWYIIPIIVAFFTRKLNQLERVKMITCRQVQIINTSPQVLQVDGESVGKHLSIEAKILPAYVNIIVSP